MITRLGICDHYGTDPYYNLALEQYLTERVQPGECILYLWQNARTIVIGRNQNAWKECDVDALRADGGKLARRLSGGGAVFHDLGNLNFTFIMATEDFDVERQLSVIIRACERFGIRAQMTGRNDLVVPDADAGTGREAAGSKFSGNAFYHHRGKSYHHGTILVDVDTGLMGRYLRPHPEKLRAKGVDSVRSRVVNLKNLNGELTIEAMREAMKEAFLEVYAGIRTDNGQIDGWRSSEGAEFSALLEKYGSDEWNLGERKEYDVSHTERFDWGLVEMSLKVKEAEVFSADVFTDSMETKWTKVYEEVFEGARFSAEGLTEAAKKAGGRVATSEQKISADMSGMIGRLCAECFSSKP